MEIHPKTAPDERESHQEQGGWRFRRARTHRGGVLFHSTSIPQYSWLLLATLICVIYMPFLGDRVTIGTGLTRASTTARSSPPLR